jgi:hypothetical protein
MTEIYAEIAKLSDKFRTMAYGLTTDKNKIDNAVQELMLYFLQMNPKVLSKIWKKDGIEGITKYGSVALRRSLTSPRSAFFYKYTKYYTNLSGFYMSHTSKDNFHKSIYNLPEEKVNDYQWTKLEEIDKALEDCTWYDKKIFELYYEGETLDSLAAKTKISRNSLFTTIDKVREMLKKKLNE